jgi:hypothetical protein
MCERRGNGVLSYRLDTLPVMRSRVPVVLWWLAVLGTILMTPGRGLAQTAAVSVEASRSAVGVDGLSRAGEWTPLRVRLTNQTSNYREVVLRWSMPDADGDVAQYERAVALNPSATTNVWTYGVLPGSARSSEIYPLRVLDGESGALLAETRVSPDTMAALDRPVIGLFSGSKLGLSFAEQPAPRHEVLTFLTGLELRRLPDRWHGLGLFKAMIWTSQGGLPTAADVSGDTLEALERWIERGGHFVLLWPATGNEWFDTPIGDLLPFSRGGILRVTGGVPAWLGQIPPNRSANISYNTFRIDPQRGGSVLLTDNDDRSSRTGRPVVVTRRHGLGRVTVIGIDWSQPAIRAMGLPNGLTTPWHDVFGWTSPAYRESFIQAEIESGAMVSPRVRTARDVSEVLSRRTSGAMREAAGPVLLGAVVIFLLYWLIAGPILDTTLGKRGHARRRWVAFAATTVAFTGLCWGAAYVARPVSLRVSHFTVLDVDVAAGQTRGRSHVTALVPRFGRAELAIAPGRDDEVNDNLLNFAGDPLEPATPGFPDTQNYRVTAARPAAANVPVRSTSKSLRIDFAGPVLAPSEGEEEPYGVEWSLPRGELTLGDTRWPEGELRHGLPAPLREVKVIYCPGDGQTPWIWRITDRWHPGETLTVSEPRQADRLIRMPPNQRYTSNRTFNREGYLGKLLSTRLGGSPAALGVGPTAAAMSDGRVIEQIELLSFFDLLPPPNFRETQQLRGVGVVRRPRGRGLDLSHLTATRCVIMIGHLADSPLPLPFTVGGNEAPSDGWTTIRSVFDLQ